MAKEAKLNFVPEKQINQDRSESGFYVTLNKNFTLYFSPEFVRVFDLDKTYLKVYADTEKKAIGWIYFEEGKLDDMKDMRKLTINKEVGSGIMGCKKLLNQLGIDDKNILTKTGKKKVQIYKSSYFTGEMNYIQL